MNNIFSIKRFGLLMKKDISEDWKKYILQALVLFSALLIPFLIQSFGVYDGSRELTTDRYARLNKDLLGIGVFVFAVAFPIFLAQMMDVIKSKQSRIHYLTFPCSALEKFASRYIIHTIGFVLTFFIALYLADFIRVFIYSMPAENVDVHYISLSKLYRDNSWEHLFRSKDITISLSSIYLLILSFYILGSTFWQKKSFIKTTVFMVLATSAFVTISYLIATAVIDKSKYIYIPLLEESPNLSYYVAGGFVFIALLLNILAYFRFKEAELIEKW